MGQDLVMMSGELFVSAMVIWLRTVYGCLAICSSKH